MLVVLLLANGCTSDGSQKGTVESSEPADSTGAEPEDATGTGSERSTVAEQDAPTGTRPDHLIRRLDEVEHWLYLIDVNLDADTIDEIVESEHDMVVLDFIPSEQQNTAFPMSDVVERLHEADHAKLVVAYIDVGQAEDFRVYWEPGWRIGEPDWIVADDPDGWEGNYPVAYWREEWHEIWIGDGGLINQITEAGFDGVYLDWVEAYSDGNVATAAALDDVDPAAEMIDWVAELAATGRDDRPGFLVIAQNAAELAAEHAEYRAVIDAVAQEQVWFDGAADNDPPGDCPLPATDEMIETEAYEATLTDPCLRQYLEFPESTLHVSSEEYLDQLDVIAAAGLPVLTVDYASEPQNVTFVLENSRAHGFVPFVGTRLLNEYIAPR
jgi:cysteinyl-tRNA synthetase